MKPRIKRALRVLAQFKDLDDLAIKDWVLSQIFLHDHKIFARATKLYAEALMSIIDQKDDVITSLGYSLAAFVEFEPDYTSEEDAEKMQAKAKKALMRTSLFRGTQFEAKLIQSLEENKE